MPRVRRDSARRSSGSVGVGSAAAIGLVAGGISLLRLWLGSSSSITENLWAEDGLFALCSAKANFLSCIVDPYAGYLHFTPRLLSAGTALSPISWWPLASNVIAAIFVGVVAGFVWILSRRARIRAFGALVVALLPTVSPVSGR